ncbi:tetratricopeptide repeat protein [Candidatus Pelagibacter bacterium nBUS_33]|uniref:tetratricopeptide repeat protein n=1 Tax=Candidatus Pelagibacter bacterium nBUS_33 TaxID=3374193 RepID=UPI003EBE9C71
MKKHFYIFIILIIFSNNILKADDISNLTELADKGDAIAQNNLGHYYLYRSDNNLENLDKAIYYLNAAAAQGQVNAMTTVGWTYFTGDHGAPQDDEQAIYWNQKASDAGFTIASYNIGFFYYSGLAGLQQDLSMAKKYWLLSASQWVDSEGLHDARANELLDEINQYNPNPTNDMVQLRDLFISLLKSKSI